MGTESFFFHSPDDGYLFGLFPVWGLCGPPPHKIPMLKLKPHRDGIRKWALGGDLVMRVAPSGMGLVSVFFKGRQELRAFHHEWRREQTVTYAPEMGSQQTANLLAPGPFLFFFNF